MKKLLINSPVLKQEKQIFNFKIDMTIIINKYKFLFLKKKCIKLKVKNNMITSNFKLVKRRFSLRLTEVLFSCTTDGNEIKIN